MIQSESVDNTTPGVHIRGRPGECKDDDRGADEWHESIGCEAVGGWRANRIRIK